MGSGEIRNFLASGIAALMPQTERLLQLREFWRQVVPANLVRSCSVANVRQGRLQVFAYNSAVAAKLRLLAPTICLEMKRRAMEVTALEVTVQPVTGLVRAPRVRPAIAKGAAPSLRARSSQLTESKLKNAVDALLHRIESKH